MSEKHIVMPARMYQARDSVRFWLGDDYLPRMREIGQMLTEIAAGSGQDVLSVATEVARDCMKDHDTVEAALIIAGVVELLEPSEGAS